MNLEKVTVVLRPRKAMEAIDLGYAMTRVWARPLWSLWFKTAGPLFFVVWFAFFHHPAWAVFATWWLRPLFDHGLLYYISRALFGAPPQPGEAVKGTLGLWRRFALASLTGLRLDPTRSFKMPTRQLEGLKGKARRERSRILGASGWEFALLLTAVSQAIELCFLLSLVLVGYMFVPADFQLDLNPALQPWFIGEGSLLLHGLYGALFFTAVSLVEPFYVAAGFALYINRRTQLEGWDIELSFRNLAQRLEKHKPEERSSTPKGNPLAGGVVKRGASKVTVSEGGFSGTLLLFLTFTILNLSSVTPGLLQAQTIETDPNPAVVIEEILGREEFGSQETIHRWKYVGPALDTLDEENERLNADLGFLSKVLTGVGGLFEILLWTLLAVALGLLVWALFRFRGTDQKSQDKQATTEPADVVFGLDVTEASLPEDIAAEALALLAAGRVTEALSLLYRGTLAALIHRQQIVIEASWTEGECLRKLKGELSEDRHIFLGKLTEFWCKSAYAHREPIAAELEALCRRWPGLFDEPAGDTA